MWVDLDGFGFPPPVPDENEMRCPMCRQDWTVTIFNMKKWKDCLKCGKTKEELVKDYNDRYKRG